MEYGVAFNKSGSDEMEKRGQVAQKTVGSHYKCYVKLWVWNRIANVPYFT